jgi:hypothetical protein
VAAKIDQAKLASRVIGMDKRARISAHGKGKEREVSKADRNKKQLILNFQAKRNL